MDKEIEARLNFVKELSKKNIPYKEQKEEYEKKFNRSEITFQKDRRILRIKEKRVGFFICQICGKKVKAIRYYAKRKKFCSQKCYHKSKNWNGFKKGINHKAENNSRWKEGKSRGYILRKAKEAVLKRNGDLEKCERCGRKNDETRLLFHHKDRNNQNNIPENVIVLCCKCHINEHFSNDKRNIYRNRDKRGKFIKSLKVY